MGMKYELLIIFKSNEKPLSNTYNPAPYGPKTDEDAVKWAAAMQEGMGNMYYVTLLKDGKFMPYDTPTTH
jgi:hypothetical protein